MQDDISIYEAAKYPWSVMARSLLKNLDVTLGEVDNNSRIVQRAKERLVTALDPRTAETKEPLSHDGFIELTSFFVAKALIDGIGSMFLRRRWATAEAKRTGRHLLKESETKLTHFAKQEFKWQISSAGLVANRIYSHKLHFSNYLAATKDFHNRGWKLVNKQLDNGYVLLRKRETVRVIQDAVEKMLIRDIKKVTADFPPNIQQVYDELNESVRTQTDRMRQEIQGEIVTEAFPPCMQALLTDLKEGKPLSHIARFAITAFLLNIGMDVDSVLDLFMRAPDFREDLARYQIEHIAGKRGSTEYTPPSCAYMISVRLCVDPDKAESRRHPLAYYRQRRKWLSRR